MIVSPEALLGQDEGRFSDREAVGEAWAEASRRFRAALADQDVLTAGVLVGCPGSGKSTWARANDSAAIVLFDAVWASQPRRIAIARRIRQAGKHAVAVFVRSPLAVALERNAARPSWRRVPEAIVRRNFLELRRTPPVGREGWSRVLVVDGTAALQHGDVRVGQ